MRETRTLPTGGEAREALRVKGQFWTPQWIAEAMVAYVMRNSPADIYDPAVGDGAFLEAFLRIRKPSSGTRFLGSDIDGSLLGGAVFSDPQAHTQVRDFALDPPSGPFDAIVANPPYIRHHRLSREVKRAFRDLTLRELGRPIDGRAGLHILFLIRALCLLNKHGRLAFIVPADTCEGVFQKALWSWIAKNFRIDHVVTFIPKATPFPGVDTNAVILMIRKEPPRPDFEWLLCREPETKALVHLVKNKNSETSDSIDRVERNLDEALRTGMSRAPASTSTKFVLGDFAAVRRGIATGANSFFLLTRAQAGRLELPQEFLRLTVGRTRDAPGDVLSSEDIQSLDEKGRPTLLLSLPAKPADELQPSVRDYLRHGESLELAKRALIRTRKPWYRMEQRATPPLLFAYLGRRNSRFIRNDAGVVPLTAFLCVYPRAPIGDHLDEFWRVLNDPETTANLRLVGKSYGGGAIKVEPRNLERLPIPDELAERLQNRAPLPAARGLFEEGPKTDRLD